MFGQGAKGRILSGIAAGAFAHTINVLSKIALVPLFLNAWGVETYGHWLLLSSIAGALALADLGGQVFIVNRLTQLYALGDHRAFEQVFAVGVTLSSFIASFAFAAFALSLAAVPYLDLMRIAIDPKLGLAVLCLVALQISLSLPVGLVIGAYRAVGAYPKGVWIHSGITGFQFLFAAAALWLGWGMIGMAISQILPIVMGLFFAIGDLRVRYPHIQLRGVARIRWLAAKQILLPSLGFFQIQISQILSIQGTVMLVGNLLGPTQVVAFSTIRMLVNLLKQMLGLISHSAWPEMTRLDAINERGKQLMLFRAQLRASMTICLLAGALLHVFGESIFAVWTGNGDLFDQNTLDIFLLYVIQSVYWTLSANLLMATNKHRRVADIMFLAAILSVVCAYFGGQHFGLPGVAAGILAGDILLPLWAIPRLLSKQMGQISIWFLVREGLPSAAFCGISYLAPVVIPVTSCLIILWGLQGIKLRQA
jgi:O-antigen/teichoic acid export membrane protein